MKKILERVRAASPFVADVLDRFPETADTDWLETAWKPGPLARVVQAAARKTAGDDPAFMAALRKLRTTELARIALRDLAGWAPLDETLGALSELAEACCEAALAQAQAPLQARHGKPRDE